ncbi:hypothetical protein ACHAWU_007142 [Discostella pseudostelligera]|uniref:Uncharacterized protein n=1 Tax=Discostella pseudostelligera TaxID=259834 RepID=A0ABD3M0C0_9STRA
MTKPRIVNRFKTIARALSFTRKRDKYFDICDFSEVTASEFGDIPPDEICVVNGISTRSAQQDSSTTIDRLHSLERGSIYHDSINENSSRRVQDVDMRKSMVSEKEFAVEMLHRKSMNKDDHNSTLQSIADATKGKSTGKLEAVMNRNMHLTSRVIFLKGANEHLTRLLSEKDLALEEARSTIAGLMEGASSTAKEVIPQRIDRSEWSVETVHHSNIEMAKAEEEAEAEEEKEVEAT